jgi:hypothetical protein
MHCLWGRRALNDDFQVPLPNLTASDMENDGPLLSFEELLHGAGEAQELQYTASSVGDGSRRADGTVGHPKPDDCIDAPTCRVGRAADKPEETDGHSSVYCSDGSTSEEQGGPPGPSSTPLVPVPVAIAKYIFRRPSTWMTLLTVGANLNVPPSVTIRQIASPTLLTITR